MFRVDDLFYRTVIMTGDTVLFLCNNFLKEKICIEYAIGTNTPGSITKGNSATKTFAGSFIK